jgi:hypothetical protein
MNTTDTTRRAVSNELILLKGQKVLPGTVIEGDSATIGSLIGVGSARELTSSEANLPTGATVATAPSVDTVTEKTIAGVDAPVRDSRRRGPANGGRVDGSDSLGA